MSAAPIPSLAALDDFGLTAQAPRGCSTARTHLDLAETWAHLTAGRLEIRFDRREGPHRVLLLRESPSPIERLSQSESWLLVRILSGETRKALACDLGISQSTLSDRSIAAFDRLGLARAVVPLAVVIAAQTYRYAFDFLHARCEVARSGGSIVHSISVPLPTLAEVAALTPAQRAVALLVMEGYSRREIAEQRHASTHTVGSQLAKLRSATKTSCRYDFIRKLLAAGTW
jgi:DNA-binding NarL/FixJ family response regulator